MNPPSACVRIELGERSYDICVVAGEALSALAQRWPDRATVACIVTNDTVAPLYLDTLVATLSASAQTVQTVILKDGEQHKTLSDLDPIFTSLLKAGADRKTVLFALGGGVVGDMTGFAAASYMRGIRFVQVPTTLLAQVDSSVGGKTGVNHPLGKNMIGAFHQPSLVVCDVSYLATLPKREFASGLAEVIKYGPIADPGFFDWLEVNMDALLQLSPDALIHAVRRCCELKADVVARDERESGLREILNFGHTFGHAIEAGMGYGTWTHGEGVAVGMLMASDLSHRLGLIDADTVQRIRRLILRAGLPVVGPTLPVDRYLALMRNDKKAQGGEIRFVLLEGMGRAITRTVPDALVREVIAAHSPPI